MKQVINPRDRSPMITIIYLKLIVVSLKRKEAISGTRFNKARIRHNCPKYLEMMGILKAYRSSVACFTIREVERTLAIFF